VVVGVGFERDHAVVGGPAEHAGGGEGGQYETLAMGLVAFGLWKLRDRLRPGLVFALYLVLAGLERFLVEFARRNEVVLGGLTAPQFESLGLLVAGLIWIGVVVTRTGSLRAEPATTQGYDSPATAASRRARRAEIRNTTTTSPIVT